jgi:hypothetical protein
MILRSLLAKSRIRTGGVLFYWPRRECPASILPFNWLDTCDGEPIRSLEDLVKMATRNIDEKPLLDISCTAHTRNGGIQRVAFSVNKCSILTEDDEPFIRSKVGLCWYVILDRILFLDVNHAFNKQLPFQEEVADCSESLLAELRALNRTEGVLLFDPTPDSDMSYFTLVSACNDIPIGGLDDLVEMAKDNVKEESLHISLGQGLAISVDPRSIIEDESVIREMFEREGVFQPPTEYS